MATLTQEQVAEIRADIAAQPFLFSARHNKDYEMLAIYCSERFPALQLTEIDVHTVMLTALKNRGASLLERRET